MIARQTLRYRCVAQDGDANVVEGIEAVRRRLEEALNSMDAHKLSDEEAFKRIDWLKARWPSTSQAQTELTNSRRRPKELQQGAVSANASTKSEAWQPRVGASVRLLRVGDTTGKVRADNAQIRLQSLLRCLS